MMIGRVRQFLWAAFAHISADDREFVERSLVPALRRLFFEMSVPDQCHAVRTARCAQMLMQAQNDAQSKTADVDAAVQEDKKISSQAELDESVKTMTIRGLGGTDFRPVFRYVDDLNSQGHFSDLRGLIYFTDGLGTYPDKMPDYRTAFIFVDDGYSIPEVPAWAMKVVLRTEDIQE